MLNKKLLEEIVKDTNHKNIESVVNALQEGDIEIYHSKEDYINDGFSLDYHDNYTTLSNGWLAHYIQ